MARSSFVTTVEDKKAQEYILLIDKKGWIGSELVKKLYKEFHIVFVTEQPQEETPTLHPISYRKRIPKIPNQRYSYVFVIQNDVSEVVDFLPEILEKTKHDKARCLYAVTIQSLDKQFVRQISSTYANVQAIIFGDLFAADAAVGSKSILTTLLAHAKTTGKLKVRDDGMRKAYPVFLPDVIDGLLEVAFGSQKSNRLFFLFPKHPPTELTLAHALQKVNPTLSVDFVKQSDKNEYPTLTFLQGSYLLPESYDLAKKIHSLKLATVDFTNKKQQSVVSSSSSLLKRASTVRLLWRHVVFTFFFILLLPFLTTTLFAMLGVWQLVNAKNSLVSAHSSRALQETKAAEGFFSASLLTFPVLESQLDLVGLRDKSSQIAKSVHYGKEFAQLLQEASIATIALQHVAAGTSETPKEDFLRANNTLKTIAQTLQQKKVEDDDMFGTTALLLKEIKPYDTLFQLVVNLSDVFPALFGFNDPKTYLVLFQNNMELRPGGGFIGSYGLATFDKGKLEKFTIHDVYDADGQLRGHIEPPYPIRRYLQSVHWFMRDSNFDVDFTKSASSAAFFLREETKQRVDGVVAVDVSFVKALVKALGPIRVPEYNETVTDENFYIVTQTHVEKNFTPGSTQKKDFLFALFQAIQKKLVEKNDAAATALLSAAGTAMREKHMLFAFADPAVQSVFTVNRLSSSLWDDRVADAGIITDFLGVNDANLGANKANYFLKRKVKQEMTVQENGSIEGKVSVFYTNTSSKWPGGDYKNYIRFILPENVSITEVQVDGEQQDVVSAVTDFLVYEKKQFTAPKALELESTRQSDKTILGFLLVVPAGKEKTVTIHYRLPHLLSASRSSFLYDDLLFKQPGTDDDPYYFSLQYPKSYAMVRSEKSDWVTNTFEKKEGSIVLITRLLQDLRIRLLLAKKTTP